jgi:hypothetical protein
MKNRNFPSISSCGDLYLAIVLSLSLAAFGATVHRASQGHRASRVSRAQMDESQAAPGTILARSKFGGDILGYDIDHNGTEGILSEGVTLSDGKLLVATETFDQKTGKIVKVVTKLNETFNDFVTIGVFGKGVGLVEEEHSKDGFVDSRTYTTLNPVEANRFTGVWTPPLKKDEILESASGIPNTPASVILAFENGGNFDTIAFSSDVAANTFGPRIRLKDPNFIFNHSPIAVMDGKKNHALIATGGSNPFGPPTIGLIDLSTKAFSEFQGLGIGMVNGVAVDPETGIACTATSIDFSVEFYNVRKKQGFLIETLPGADNQIESGGDVEFDPIHKLFFVEQYTSNGNINDTQPRIYVYDEKGNLKETIGGLVRIPISPVNIALNPNTRTGFILDDTLTELRSFKY